jgi:hypothetical protein
MTKQKNVNDSDDELITQSEAAQLREVTVAAISALVQRGRLRSVERFGKLLVYRSEVLAFEREKPGRKKNDGGK